MGRSKSNNNSALKYDGFLCKVCSPTKRFAAKPKQHFPKKHKGKLSGMDEGKYAKEWLTLKRFIVPDNHGELLEVFSPIMFRNYKIS